jgi:transcriptional regulator with XRE-family HTH domain
MAEERSDLPLLLALLRVAIGWKQGKVARASGITNSAISEYERGKKTPDLKSLQKIVFGMGFRLSALDLAEDFLRDLRAEKLAAEGAGAYAEGAGRPSEIAEAGSALGEGAAVPAKSRARRVSAQVGQAAESFSLALLEALERPRDEDG